jgi:phosphoribosylanthranilate isomerase
MKVKICGITTLDDAIMAAEAGADMLGFNFYMQSPRYIKPAVCASILLRFYDRGFTTPAVGVFVNEPVGKVWETMDNCSLQLAQLHGDETPNELMELGSRAYKAIRPRNLEEAKRLLQEFSGCGASEPGFLLDTHQVGSYGGTGLRADWKVAAEIALETNLFLAGGLIPESVVPAIQSVNPWGVDVASGVESAPGKKDRQKVLDFVEAVRNYENDIEP